MSKNMIPLGEIVDFIGGGTPSRDANHYWNGDIPWASVKDFKGPSINSTKESITREGLSASSSTLISSGHVIMPTRMALGKAAINSIDVAINQDLKALRPKAQVDTRYLLHAILSRAQEIQSHGKGATVQGITIERLSAIQIPLPPLEEQRRIAAILDRVQDLEKLAESQIKKSSALANSSFQKSIDEARFRGTLKEESLGSISIVAGQYGANCSSAPYDASLPRYVRITDIQDDGLLSPVLVSPAGPPNGWADLRLDPGDLLFARSGATVGKTYMHTNSDGDCVFAGYLIRFRLDARIALPEFVYGFTRTEAYRSWVTNTQRAVAQPNINAKQYSSLAISLPPLDEQQAYCATYRHTKKLSEAAREMQFHLSQLRHSLSRNLFDHQGDLL